MDPSLSASQGLVAAELDAPAERRHGLRALYDTGRTADTWASKLPKCRDCGAPRPHVANVSFFVSGKREIRHEWLCEDCEYRRDHPDAPRAVKMPCERRPKKLQNEVLF